MKNILIVALIVLKKFNEILIIDGGSKDETLKIAKKFKCKIKQQPKQFKFNNNKIRDFSKLRKYILKLSKNELVLFLDSDEFLKRTALKKIDFYSKSQTSKKKILLVFTWKISYA